MKTDAYNYHIISKFMHAVLLNTSCLLLKCSKVVPVLVQSFKPVQRECKLLLVRVLLFYIYFAQVLNGYSGCKSLVIQAVHVLNFDLSPSSNIAK